ncbi:unnamed protein product [Dovyalis caffra]|uniref:Uncharacterized protein n=1 Tax=Dovyalis caffra TaxID=77055 RepID=A0AAV1S488_9ROSI|nr:unnamed protein product [Dovyalis caffra]
MEGLVKKYQQRFRKVREIMDEWEELQSRLIEKFRNASVIIERLKVIQDGNNYGNLKSVDGIVDAVVRKQMESLQTLLLSMNKTLEEFRGLVLGIERMNRDGRQLVKGGGGSNQLNAKQLRQRIGIKPCLADCLDGLIILHDMHQAEYLLKSSIVSALSALTLKPSSSDLGALQQLLIDQPNIPKVEVQVIFEIVFAEDIC